MIPPRKLGGFMKITCNRCEKEKELEEFVSSMYAKNKKRKLCKECHNGNVRKKRIEKFGTVSEKRIERIMEYRKSQGISLDLPIKQTRKGEGYINYYGYRQFTGNKFKDHPNSDNMYMDIVHPGEHGAELIAAGWLQVFQSIKR